MQNAFSQKDSISKYIIFRKDTLRAGNEYIFYLNYNKEVRGTFLGIVEDNFLVYNDRLVDEVDTSSVQKIISAKEYLRLKEKSESNKRTFIYAGAGYLISVPVSSHKFSNGIDITFKWLFLLSNKSALRADFDYFKLDREYYTVTSTDFAGVTRITEYKGGDAKAYLFKVNYLTGELDHRKPAMYYALFGAGFGSTKITEIYNTYIKGSIQPYNLTEIDKFSSISYGFSAGLGGNIKISSGIRTFADLQYNIWYTGSGGPSGFVTAKLGFVL